MSTPKGLFTALLGGMILLGAVCLGWILALNNGLPAPAVVAPLLQGIFCCDPLHHLPVPGLPPGLRFFHLIGMGLLATGLGAVLYKAWQTTRFSTRLLKSASTETPLKLSPILPELPFQRNVVVIRAVDPFALCCGFLHPRICLSSGLIEALSPDQIRAVVYHEEHHRRRWDPLRILMLEGVRVMFFFVPVIREWCADYRTRLELDADQYAMDRVGRSPLAGALHRLMMWDSASARVETGAITVGLSSSAARIAQLLGEEPAQKHHSRDSLLRSTPGLLLICLLLAV